MRLPVLVLLALSALNPAVGSAQATLNKCIDAEGRVTYSNLPCRNAKETRTIEVDSPPQADSERSVPARQPARPAAAEPALRPEPATLRLDTQRATAKPASNASARQCDALTDKLGRVFDKMDAARRKGYTQDQMNTWNEEAKDLERKKQQSGCF